MKNFNSEKNIVSNQNGQITFKYIESKTGQTQYRTLKGEDFLHLIMQHVLPKGFRRVRDYGFLHSNAKKLLFLVLLRLTKAIFYDIAFPTPYSKKDIFYIQTVTQILPGSSNNRIRLWFVPHTIYPYSLSS
ncbi:MAG: transposase [Thermodesulfobacteriota bacterium]|nr:transposase [Thermodesulfobacteriota bacterium]